MAFIPQDSIVAISRTDLIISTLYTLIWNRPHDTSRDSKSKTHNRPTCATAVQSVGAIQLVPLSLSLGNEGLRSKSSASKLPATTARQTRPHWSFRAMDEVLPRLSCYQLIIGRRSRAENIMWSPMVTMVTLLTANPGQPGSFQGKGIKKRKEDALGICQRVRKSIGTTPSEFTLGFGFGVLFDSCLARTIDPKAVD